MIPIVIGAPERFPQRPGKGDRRVGNQKTNRDHPKYSIFKIVKNTEKGPGELRRPVVTPMRDHQPTLM